MDCLIFFYTFNIVLGGKGGGAEVVVFKKTNEKQKSIALSVRCSK